VTATFNEAVQSGTISVKLTNSSGTSVATTTSYNSSNFTVNLIPSASLAYSTTYTATVSGAKDLAGDPMCGSVVWSFKTAAQNTAVPTLIAESPGPGATEVPVSSSEAAILPVSATFNQAVQLSTINFTLTSSSGTLVASSIWYSDATNTATLTPEATLATSTTYTATISGAENSNGVAMSAPVTWSFTTDPTAMPTVMNTSPPLNAPSVDISTPIAVNFNEAVLASSISSANFTLKTASGTAVPATITYTATGALYTATLTPTAALAYSTTYTATISGVKDANGNTMAGSYAWSFATASGSSTYTQLPLLYQSNLQYLGGFRVPNFYNSISQTSYAGQGLAYDAADNSLFMAGDVNDNSVLQISIPSSIVNSTNLDSLATDSDLSNFVLALNSIPNTSGFDAGDGAGTDLGGLVVANGQLIGTEYNYYDTSGATSVTHFRFDSLNLSTAQVEGMFEVSAGTLGGGAPGPGGAAAFYAGYMATIPSAWQSALGAPYLTGNGALSIINRTSSGPALFGFNPSTLSTSSTTPATPYIYYPLPEALGTQDSYDPLFDGNTNLNGVFFAPGSSSVLVFGSVGTNQVQYGTPSQSNDPYRQGKGFHALNGDYAYQVWAYNANDFLSVMNGKMQPWQVQPYATWNLDFPQFQGGKTLGGVTFDPSTNRLYVMEQGADTEAQSSYLPVIQVFQLTLSTAGTGATSNALIAQASEASSNTSAAAPAVTSASTTTTAMAVTPASATTSGSQNTLLGTVAEFDANPTGSGSVLTGSAAPVQQRQPLPSGPRFASKAKAVKPPQKAAAQTPIVLRHIVVNDGGAVRLLLGPHDTNGE